MACVASDPVTSLHYAVALAGAADDRGERLRDSDLIDGQPGTLVLPVAVRLCATHQAQSTCGTPVPLVGS